MQRFGGVEKDHSYNLERRKLGTTWSSFIMLSLFMKRVITLLFNFYIRPAQLLNHDPDFGERRPLPVGVGLDHAWPSEWGKHNMKNIIALY